MENKISKKEQRRLVSQGASDMGKLGGRALVKSRGKKYMQELGKKASDARWHPKTKKSK